MELANETFDIVIVGSGIGGATMAHGLAGTGARILILEKGRQLVDTPQTRDDRAIFQQGAFRSAEHWFDAQGNGFSPGNYYNVGGNSKFFGAVMFRFRAEDFVRREHSGGATYGWPIGYDELEPWYCRAERLFRVHGRLGEDPTEPSHSQDYPCPPVPDEPSIALVRERLRGVGLHPSTLPLAVDIEQWLKRAPTPWDGFPDTFTGKTDAETGPLALALAHPNVTLLQDAEVLGFKPSPDGRRVVAALVRHGGATVPIRAERFVLAAGAVNSAALLLRSEGPAGRGLANGSDQVGRNFMNHNCTAMLAINPRIRNSSVYQKTLAVNDFYLRDPKTGMQLGNVQLLGKISAPILKANLNAAPEALLRPVANRSFDWYLMSEDLPNPDSRVKVSGDRIVLDWQRSNLDAHHALVARMREMLRAAGFPIVLSRAFDKRTPSHQCSTAIMGNDPSASVVDSFGKSYDLTNLWIMDASVLPTSAAVNPALTIAALSLRAAARISQQIGGGTQ